MNKGHILLVDDEVGLRTEVSKGLERFGYRVDEVDSVDMALERLDQQAYGLVLLDITMPEKDGWALLPDVVNDWELPVIVLTANSDLNTRIRAFREGATDYIAKPFFMEELVARIQTRLRIEQLGSAKSIIEFGLCRIDLDARDVSVGGETVKMTQAEFDILSYFASRPGRPVTRAVLAENALGQDGDRFDRTIDSHVSRIRSKLGDAGNHIETVWGIGWKLVQDPST